MEKINITRFAKAFIHLETFFVAVPVIFMLFTSAIIKIGSSFDFGDNIFIEMLFVFCAVVMCAISNVYFILPSLLAPEMFRFETVGFAPINISGWFFAVGLYSLFAWLLSLIISLSVKRNKEFISKNLPELAVKNNLL